MFQVRRFGHISPRSPRGIALLSALLAVTLLLALLTAVLGGLRAKGDIVRYDKNLRTSEEAAQSMLHYARFKLEESQQWLAEDELSVVPPRDEHGQLMFEVDDIEREEFRLGDYIIGIKGRVFVPEEVVFELTITNNFASDERAHGLRPHSGSVEIKTSFNSSEVHLLSTLKNAAFANSTVAASGDISIKTDKVIFKTKDPHRNQIRSEQNVMLPQVEDMLFETATNWQRGEKGTVWAYGDILVGPEDDPLPLEEATDETGARFMPNGRQEYNVPRLRAEQVGANPEVDTITPMPAGSYTVGLRQLFFDDTSGKTHERTVPLVLVDGQEVYFPRNMLQKNLPPIDFESVRLSEDGAPITANPMEKRKFHIGPAEFVLTADEESSCKVRMPAGAKIVCKGDLRISGTSSEDLPRLVFKQPEKTVKPVKGHLEVTDGNLTLACNVRRAGLLMASGDVNLQPEDMKVSASAAEDVAIYAGGNVNIDASMVSPSPGYASSGDRKLVFKGLVYAGKDFNFDTDTGLRTPTGEQIHYSRDIEVIGSVVAHGEVRMEGTQAATLTYDPEFLNDVMESSVRGSSKRLEVVSTLEL